LVAFSAQRVDAFLDGGAQQLGVVGIGDHVHAEADELLALGDVGGGAADVLAGLLARRDDALLRVDEGVVLYPY